MKKNQKLVLGAVAGAVALGYFFSTKPGKKIAKKISKETKDLVSETIDRLKQGGNDTSFDNIADKIVDYAVKNRDTLTGIFMSLFKKS